MGDHILSKRVVSEELEIVAQSGPGGRGEIMERLHGRGT